MEDARMSPMLGAVVPAYAEYRRATAGAARLGTLAESFAVLRACVIRSPDRKARGSLALGPRRPRTSRGLAGATLTMWSARALDAQSRTAGGRRWKRTMWMPPLGGTTA